MNDIHNWLTGNLNVAVKGSLVMCGNSVYSYQMKIGNLDKRFVPHRLHLVDKTESPSVTTSKHLGLVRNAASDVNIPVIESPLFE